MIKALIVEDEVDLCQLLSLQLRVMGVSNEYVNTVKEAKRKIQDNRYELMFLDLNLTDGSGFEVLSMLNDSGNNLRVVVVSAYDVERKKALDLGADFFIAKPFTKKAIEHIVQLFLKN
ncbi:MAG: response regulator [Cyclobacteriaceae bacterium]|nr:response regulator [Cyclobacteriaceae bacterium]